MKNNYTGKKSPTNPTRKEQHEYRKIKQIYLDELREKEQQQTLKDFIKGLKKDADPEI